MREQVSLFGCNNGLIPGCLELQIPPGQSEPYLWHLDIEKSLCKVNNKHKGSTLVIDLKPKQHGSNVSLYEILDVWGYSSSGWTPILLHLGGLFVDADPNSVNRNDFTISDSEIDGPIYEVLYLAGSIENGKIIGRWNTPPASPTNAPLLWPDTLNYFIRCIRERTPDVLK
ncbi:MAG: hypothetical protein U9O65_03055 [Thermotogota bacterium]|nr:hypothetical protein [Thermotogota bacterium]